MLGLDPDDDLDRLTGELATMAFHLLTRKGRFWPFGAVVWSGGEIQLAAAPVETDERFPKAETLRQRLIDELRGEAIDGQIRAAGVATDGRAVEIAGHGETDAVGLHLESSDGRAETRLIVYERRFPRRLRIDPDTVYEPADRLIFPAVG